MDNFSKPYNQDNSIVTATQNPSSPATIQEIQVMLQKARIQPYQTPLIDYVNHHILSPLEPIEPLEPTNTNPNTELLDYKEKYAMLSKKHRGLYTEYHDERARLLKTILKNEEEKAKMVKNKEEMEKQNKDLLIKLEKTEIELAKIKNHNNSIQNLGI